VDDLDERQRRQFALEAGDAPPHPVLDSFGSWHGWVEPGWDVNFLGVRTRVAYFSLYEQLADFSQGREREAGPPIPNEDYFEWIALLEAVAEAEGSFTMVELGAGWGKWIVNGVAALRARGALPYRVVGVESEPTHFRWMKQHLDDNGVDLGRARLIEAAVAGEDGSVWFHVGAAADWYGQAIAAEPPEATPRLRDRLARSLLRREPEPSAERSVQRVRAVSVRTVLEGLDRVDLVDVDIQGAEAEALEPAAAVLDEKVKRIYVATHSRENEARVRAVFGDLGWTCAYDFPGGEASNTPWGTIMFEDGAQVWHKPKAAQQR
jgi:FkbM family methyltransferase